MKIKHINLIIMIVAMMLLCSCATEQHIENCTSGHVYGFLGGLWHGLISPISFFGSLAFDSIKVYAVNNTGAAYDGGFLFGVAVSVGAVLKLW